MKKLILLLAIMLLIPSTVFSAQVNVVKLPDGVDKVCSESVEGRIKYMNAEGKYGFLDDDYNIVVSAQYEVACDYSNGTAIVSYGPVLHNWGVIDLDGNEIIPAIYDYIKPFNSAGITVVENSDGKDALANRNGELLTDWYDYNSCFTDGAAIMKNIDEKSIILINDKLEKIDLGKYDEVSDYIYDGLIAAAKDGKLGYLDTDGSEVLPFIYYLDSNNAALSVSNCSFSNGLARISFDGVHYGFINTDGEIVVPTIYDRIVEFGDYGKDELAYAEKDGVSYLVNKSGEAVYSYIDRFEPCVWIDGEKWHIDLKSGGIYKYKIESEFYDGAALAFDEDCEAYGIVDENYNIIHDFDIPAEYVSISRGHDSGIRLIPCELSEGLIKVCIDGKWGYMNTRGEMVIEPKFDRIYKPYDGTVFTGSDYIVVGAEKFRHGYAKVSLNGVRYTIDKNGELYENIDIVEPTGVNDFSCYLFLDNDYAALRDANENVILEVRDGTVTDANGSVLIENCATELFGTEENRSHPAIGFAADGGSTCGNILNVNTADGKYAVEIVGSE